MVSNCKFVGLGVMGLRDTGIAGYRSVGISFCREFVLSGVRDSEYLLRYSEKGGGDFTTEPVSQTGQYNEKHNPNPHGMRDNERRFDHN